MGRVNEVNGYDKSKARNSRFFAFFPIFWTFRCFALNIKTILAISRHCVSYLDFLFMRPSLCSRRPCNLNCLINLGLWPFLNYHRRRIPNIISAFFATFQTQERMNLNSIMSTYITKNVRCWEHQLGQARKFKCIFFWAWMGVKGSRVVLRDPGDSLLHGM